MTVKREIAESFEIPVQEISGYIKTILSEKKRFYSYTQITQITEDCFDTVIKPIGWPLILSTKMTITFYKNEELTEVLVRTTSKKMVFHDLFNMYNGYINNFLGRLRSYS
ncbi:hypothetical protein H4J38_14035 [Colwellia sp. BRX10-3]|uniref:hypothetical protein n=1 Tax=Colwellia sp. BRX10-3 TaxID=2759844 RepID=UPI0015F39B4F|nr:hypothetical protein [Colwellia sp. BRX10-3]MBA6391890.1 hypothetical protein [Colwellia sp. BRX10-3]